MRNGRSRYLRTQYFVVLVSIPFMLGFFRANEATLKSISAGKIGCPPDSINISDFKRQRNFIFNVLSWKATCGSKTYSCSGNLEESSCAFFSSSKSKGNPTRNADPDIRKAQRALVDLGYEPGPADGVMGKKTRVAVREFQADNGLSVTGKLDSGTLAAITNYEHVSGTEGLVEIGGENNLGDKTSTINEIKAENNCTVEMVFDMKEIGLTVEQIEAACSE